MIYTSWRIVCIPMTGSQSSNQGPKVATTPQKAHAWLTCVSSLKCPRWQTQAETTTLNLEMIRNGYQIYQWILIICKKSCVNHPPVELSDGFLPLFRSQVPLGKPWGNPWGNHGIQGTIPFANHGSAGVVVA